MTSKKTKKTDTETKTIPKDNKYVNLEKRIQKLEGKILSLQKKAKGKSKEEKAKVKHDTAGQLSALLGYFKLKIEYIDGKPIVSENRTKEELKARERQVLASNVGV